MEKNHVKDSQFLFSITAALCLQLTLCLCVPARFPMRKRKLVAAEEAVVDQQKLNAKWLEDGF